MNLKTWKSNTQAQSFTINSSCGIQSKAFDKSVNKAFLCYQSFSSIFQLLE